MWYQKKTESEVWDKDDNGNDRKRMKVEYDSDCKVHGFQYKFSAFNMPMIIKYNKVPGGFFNASELSFTAYNAWVDLAWQELEGFFPPEARSRE